MPEKLPVRHFIDGVEVTGEEAMAWEAEHKPCRQLGPATPSIADAAFDIAARYWQSGEDVSESEHWEELADDPH